MAQMAARVWPAQPLMVAAVTARMAKHQQLNFAPAMAARHPQAVAVGTLGVTGTDMIKADGASLVYHH